MRAAMDSSLGQLAARQHGAVTRAQALTSGFSPSAITRKLQRGEWRSADPGVYLLPGHPRSWLQEVMVACLASEGVASHRTAGALWTVLGQSPAPIEVVVEAARRPRSNRRLRVYRTRAPLEVVELSGISCCALGPTLIQLSEVLDARALERAIAAACLIEPGALHWLADTLVGSRRGHASSVAFRGLLAQLLPDEGTPPLDALLRRARVRPGVRGHLGLDVAWPERQVGLQVFDHREHGRGQQLNALQLQGWTILITHQRELRHWQAALAKRLRLALGLRP